MTLPFVSRGRYEDAVERYRDRDAEFKALLQDFTSLKLQGAFVPEPAPTLTRKDPDPVMRAISNAAGSDVRLRGVMVLAAKQARTMGQHDDEIIANIERGIAVDDGVPA